MIITAFDALTKMGKVDISNANYYFGNGYNNDYINSMMGHPPLDKGTFDLYLGNDYLDTTIGPTTKNYQFLYSLLTIFITMGILLYRFTSKWRKTDGQCKVIKDKYDNITLRKIDEEINQQSTMCFIKHKLYITSNYIVSAANTNAIIPLDSITEFHIDKYAGRTYLAAVTEDGCINEFTNDMNIIEWDDLCNRIINYMKERLPNLTIVYKKGYDKLLEADLDRIINETKAK